MRNTGVFVLLLCVAATVLAQVPNDISKRTCPSGTHKCGFVPCRLVQCPNHPTAICKNYRCGELCEAEFWVNNNTVEVTKSCDFHGTGSADNLFNAVFGTDPNAQRQLGAALDLPPAMNPNPPPPNPNANINPIVDSLLSTIDLKSLNIPGMDLSALGSNPFAPGAKPGPAVKPGANRNPSPNPSADLSLGAKPAPLCPNGKRQVTCLKRPCEVNTCPGVAGAVCRDDYCGGCNVKYSLGGNDVTHRCHQKPPAPVPAKPAPAPNQPQGDLLNTLLTQVLNPAAAAPAPAPAPAPQAKPAPQANANANAQLNALVAALSPKAPQQQQNPLLAALGLPKPDPLQQLAQNPDLQRSLAALLPQQQQSPAAALQKLVAAANRQQAQAKDLEAIARLLQRLPGAGLAGIVPQKPRTDKLLGKCPMFTPILQCAYSPCTKRTCLSIPAAECQDYNCGRCAAKFFFHGEEVTHLCNRRLGRVIPRGRQRGGNMGRIMPYMMMGDFMM